MNTRNIFGMSLCCSERVNQAARTNVNKITIIGVDWAAAPSNRNIFTWIVKRALNEISNKS